MFGESTKVRIKNMFKELSYECLLDFFKIPSLKNRKMSLCTFYLIRNYLVYFPPTGFLPSPMNHTSTRIYNPFGYYLPHAQP